MALPSMILVHPSLTSRLNAISQKLDQSQITNPHPDLLYLDDEQKLGVEQTKNIKRFLSLKPYQAKGRVIALVSAHHLTVDAQNSLLKILEEPPPNTLILLGVDSDLSLIPTILSRSQIEYLDGPELGEIDFSQDIAKLLTQDVNERFVYIEKLDKKREFFISLAKYFQKKMQQNPSLYSFNKLLIEAGQWFDANINQRAILEYLMLNMPSDK